MIIDLFIFLIGACVGSFLNVCIVRMPHEQSVLKPSSHCPQCKTPIAWYNNIPLLSYWILFGKCPDCSQKFSARYFFIELLTAITFVLFYRYFGLANVLVPYLFMVSCFIVATFVDFKHRIIPDEISIGGMFFGLLFSAVVVGLHNTAPETLALGRVVMRAIVVIFFVLALLQYVFSKNKEEQEGIFIYAFIIVLFCVDVFISWVVNNFSALNPALVPYLLTLDAGILGVLIGGGLIYLMGMLGDLLFRKESMGGGDVKLLAMMGAFLGWQGAIIIFFLAPFFGAVFGIIEKIRTKKSEIPYGPFLVLAALIYLFYSEQLILFVKTIYRIP